jgi:hypothetical protein
MEGNIMDLKQFFQENNGQSSMTRLLVFIGIIYAMTFTAFYTFSGVKPGTGEVIALFTAMTGVFIGLKLGQKPMEK